MRPSTDVSGRLLDVNPDFGAVLFAALAVVVAVIFIAIRLGPRAADTGERSRQLRERVADLEAEVRRLREQLADLEAEVRRTHSGATGITNLGGPGVAPPRHEGAPWERS